MLIALQRIAAHQLRKTVGLVRGRGADRAHLKQVYREARLRQLPRGFRTCQSATDDLYRLQISV